MRAYALVLIAAGGFATAVLALASEVAHGPRLVAALEHRAASALAAAGTPSVTARFHDSRGWLTRHPELVGGEGLDSAARTRAAQAVAALPGVGGVRWEDTGGMQAVIAEAGQHDCKSDVDAILKSRTIRFAEASAAIDPASHELLDEVAQALRPCLGSVIAIIGHTDGQGQEPANVALSQARAEAVRGALVRRGIAAHGLRARGVGSARPVAGLDPADPANRRIEFSVILPAPVRPTPVDTPGPM